MASNTDAPFVEDVNVNQELLSHTGASKLKQNPRFHVSNQPGANSPGTDSDNEDAPLLSPTGDDYESVNGGSNGDEEEEWSGLSEFRGLPWWKRPSVRASRYQRECELSDNIRYTGFSRPFSCSPSRLVVSSFRKST